MNCDSKRGNDSIILGIDVLNLIVQHPFIGFVFMAGHMMMWNSLQVLILMSLWVQMVGIQCKVLYTPFFILINGEVVNI